MTTTGQTQVISARIPATVQAALTRTAAQSWASVADGLDCLLRHSFENCRVLLPLADCVDQLDWKLDVRIPIMTFESLRSSAERLGIPISVYIRKLLYHFLVTKKLRYVQSNGHYTLAGNHD